MAPTAWAPQGMDNPICLPRKELRKCSWGSSPGVCPQQWAQLGRVPSSCREPPCQRPIKARPCPQLCLGFLAEFLNEMMLHGEMILKEERETCLRLSEEQVVAACLLQLKTGMRSDGGTCAGPCPGDLLPGAFPSAMCPAAFLLWGPLINTKASFRLCLTLEVLRSGWKGKEGGSPWGFLCAMGGKAGPKFDLIYLTFWE